VADLLFPTEMNIFMDDLVTAGRQLGLPMAVMTSYGPDIARFVDRAQPSRHCISPCAQDGLIAAREREAH